MVRLIREAGCKPAEIATNFEGVARLLDLLTSGTGCGYRRGRIELAWPARAKSLVRIRAGQTGEAGQRTRESPPQKDDRDPSSRITRELAGERRPARQSATNRLSPATPRRGLVCKRYHLPLGPISGCSPSNISSGANGGRRWRCWFTWTPRSMNGSWGGQRRICWSDVAASLRNSLSSLSRPPCSGSPQA
jgi:hypothetical protein